MLRVVDLMEKIENEHNIEHGLIKVHVMIETAVGVQNVFEIASAHPRVEAITIGGQDLTADMGIVKTRDNAGIDYARKAIVFFHKKGLLKERKKTREFPNYLKKKLLLEPKIKFDDVE